MKALEALYLTHAVLSRDKPDPKTLTFEDYVEIYNKAFIASINAAIQRGEFWCTIDAATRLLDARNRIRRTGDPSEVALRKLKKLGYKLYTYKSLPKTINVANNPHVVVSWRFVE